MSRRSLAGSSILFCALRKMTPGNAGQSVPLGMGDGLLNGGPAHSGLSRAKGDLLDEARAPTISTDRPRHPTRLHRLALTIYDHPFRYLMHPIRSFLSVALFLLLSVSAAAAARTPSPAVGNAQWRRRQK